MAIAEPCLTENNSQYNLSFLIVTAGIKSSRQGSVFKNVDILSLKQMFGRGTEFL